MKPLRFKFDNSLNLRKPIKERASIIISLEFAKFLLHHPGIEKLLSDLN